MATILSDLLKYRIVRHLTGEETTWVNTGTMASIKIYTGTQPATPQDTETGSLLATISISSSNFTGATGGVSELVGAIPFTPSATGTAGWARVYNSVSSALVDVSCSLTGGGGGIVLDTLSLVSGTGANISAFSVKQSLEVSGRILLSEGVANRVVDWITGKVTNDCRVFDNNTQYVFGGTIPTVVTSTIDGYIGRCDSMTGASSGTAGVMYIPFSTQSYTVNGGGGIATYMKMIYGSYAALFVLSTDGSGGLDVSTLNCTTTISNWINPQQFTW